MSVLHTMLYVILCCALETDTSVDQGAVVLVNNYLLFTVIFSAIGDIIFDMLITVALFYTMRAFCFVIL